MINGSQLGRLLTMRRLASCLLLFLMLFDLALHVGESYLEDEQTSPGNPTFLSVYHPSPHGDESNCPIPGHSGGLFHHHHYPGIITADTFVSPTTLLALVSTAPVQLAGATLPIEYPGRAPPSLA